MSKRVRYTGDAGIRVLSAHDFKNVGVEDQGQIKVAGVNLHDKSQAPSVVEVSDAAADYLVNNEQFALVEETKDK